MLTKKLVLIFSCLILVSCQPQTINPTKDVKPTWWIEFDKHITTVLNDENGVFVLAPGLENDPDCKKADVVTDMVLQKYGQAMIDGISYLKINEDLAQEKFDYAINMLARFALTTYCYSMDNIQLWDHVIARWWKITANEPEPVQNFCDVIKATWNPALQIVDSIQVTGESEIVETFSLLQSKIKNCLLDYPVDKYGASWLDDFGSGKLYMIRTDKSFQNLLRVVGEPWRLGLGICGLADLARMDSPICDAGFIDKSPLCQQNSNFEDELLSLGVADLNIHKTLDPSGKWNFIGEVVYPRSYFGVETKQLLDGGSPMSSLLKQNCDNGGNGFIQPKEVSCLFVRPIQERLNVGQRMAVCHKKFGPKLGEAYVAPKIKIDWNKTDCGSKDPEDPEDLSHEALTEEMSKIIDRFQFLATLGLVVDKNGNEVQPFTPSKSPSEAVKEGEKSTRAAFDQNASEGCKQNKDCYGTYDPSTKEYTIRPGLTSEQESQTKFHELLHPSMDAAGINTDWEVKPLKGKDPYLRNLQEFLLMQQNLYPNPESGYCGASASNIRAQRLFECIYPTTENPLINPLVPYIYPDPEKPNPGNSGLNCENVQMTKIWGSGKDSGYFDPPQEYIEGGGPFIIDWHKVWNSNIGTIDPPRPLLDEADFKRMLWYLKVQWPEGLTTTKEPTQ